MRYPAGVFQMVPGGASATMELSVSNTGGGLCIPPEMRTCSAAAGLQVVRMRVKEVTFGGDGFHVIAKDDSTGDYDTPHWQDNSDPPDGDAADAGDRRFPVACTRNTTMLVSATLVVEPPSQFGGNILVRGDGPGDLDFAASATLSGQNGDELTITNVLAEAPLPNEIGFVGPMIITWRVSRDDGVTWLCGAKSDNRVYVLLGQPLLPSLYETVVHLGCSNAGTLTNPDQVLAAVWSDFTDRDVRRKPIDGFNTPDGVQMKYWNPPGSASQTLQGMLADPNGNGTCVTWSQLLQETLRAQGIGGAQIYELTPVYTDDPEFGSNRGVMLVENWRFIGAGSVLPGCEPFTHLESETVDESGVLGQGNADPPGGFYNHFIGYYDGEWYDPSYGAGPYADQVSWEDASIDGYRKGCASLGAYVSKENTTGTLEMQFIP